jgi:hypothetical protein
MAHYTLVEDLVWDGQENAHLAQAILKTTKPLRKALCGKSGEDEGDCDVMFYPWHLLPERRALASIYSLRIIRKMNQGEIRQLLEKAEGELRISYEANLVTVRNFFE